MTDYKQPHYAGGLVENVTQAIMSPSSEPRWPSPCQWDRWCQEAAEKMGMTRAELQARLDAGESELEISFTFRPVQER